MAWTICTRPDGQRVLINIDQQVRIYPSDQTGQPNANSVIDGGDGKSQIVREKLDELFKKIS